MQTLTLPELQKEVTGAQSVIIKFSTPACGWCKQIQPELESINENFKDTVVIKEFMMSDPEDISYAKSLGVTAVPTMIRFIKGQCAGMLVGQQRLNTIINELVNG